MTTEPELALIMLAASGDFGSSTASGGRASNIFRSDPDRTEYGAFEAVASISGTAYAVGGSGMVYKLGEGLRWTRMDSGLPSDIEIVAIDGFGATDIYAVGDAGEAWEFDGSTWTRIPMPTNVNLTCVKCAGDGFVYIGGCDGTLLKGRNSTWQSLAADDTTETFWDLEWFQGALYLSTMLFVYRLVQDHLELESFGADFPDTCYQLSVCEEALWSIGSNDVMEFDGKDWRRIV